MHLKAVVMLLLWTCALSVRTAQAAYFCSAEAKRGGIQYSDAEGVQWEVANLRYEKTPFLGSYLACAQMLDRVDRQINTSTSLIKLYPIEEQMARFRSRDPMVDLCLDSPACRLDPLQSWFMPGMLWKSWHREDLFARHPHCRDSLRKTAPVGDEFEEESEQRMKDQVLQVGQIWTIPDQPLVERLFQQIEKNRPDRILMTSMIFSKSVLRRIDDWLLKHPGTEAWIFFAYNLHVMEGGFPDAYRPRSKGLYLVPVFQTPEAEDSYHIKGVGFRGRKTGIHLMTVNIRRFREEKVADVVTELTGQDSYRSLEALLANVLDQQCENRKYLDCSNLLRYAETDSRARLISSWVDRACADRKKLTSSEKQDLFVRGGDGVVEATILEEISRARSTIDVASHVLNRSKVSDALLEAVGRGVKVRILVGTPIQDEAFQKSLEKQVQLKFQTRKERVTAHAKFVLIDGSQVIWGTGNLTKTSLLNPWEIFIRTRNLQFISALSSYFDRYHPGDTPVTKGKVVSPSAPVSPPRPIGDWFEN
jgi:hypothetical protein